MLPRGRDESLLVMGKTYDKFVDKFGDTQSFVD
jgi:hypothetical protein